MKLQDERSAYNNIFRAAVAAEPSCNIVSNPYKTKTVTLIIKGEESHYGPKPWKTMIDLYASAVVDASLKIFPNSNHFFSHNGKLSKELHLMVVVIIQWL